MFLKQGFMLVFSFSPRMWVTILRERESPLCSLLSATLQQNKPNNRGLEVTKNRLFTLSFSQVDIVLLMSVNPGFGGQKFIGNTLRKARQARKVSDEEMKRSGRKIRLEIDGGVSPANIKVLAQDL